ncbi:phage holin family protein [Porphyrobacter sp. AAP60]|uniref:phage holin family protein n=1 Tax=Porphyrobacter sp. AAP60 TaxID=1523423 RepID=UPI0006B998E2|nr:phage holin family protein [Porphyrobacter sp. AAP60]
MDNNEPGPLRPLDDLAEIPGSEPALPENMDGEGESGFSELRDDISALVEDARLYAEAEVAFQKTRAQLAGKLAGRSLVLLVLALVLLHIALIALAVGVVIALAPYVTIWGAIAIVVGVLLIGVAVLVYSAIGSGKQVGAMFGSDDTP